MGQMSRAQVVGRKHDIELDQVSGDRCDETDMREAYEMSSGAGDRITQTLKDDEKGNQARTVPVLLMSFIFLSGFGDAIQMIPLLQIWRFFICQETTSRYELSSRSYGANNFTTSAICETEAITKQVALLNGWVMALGMLLAVVTTLFWGRMSDQHGRLRILKLCALGSLASQVLTVCAFWTWRYTNVVGLYFATVILGLFGGGSVLVALCYATLTDVLDPEARLVWFARSVGIWYASRIIGPTIGSWLLEWQMLTPIYVSTLFQVASFAILFLLPETLKLVPSIPHDSTHLVHELKESFTALTLCFKSRNMKLITIASFSYYFGISIIPILTVYVNIQYHWSIAAAGYLASYQAVLKFFVAVIVLPYSKIIYLRRDRNANSTGFDIGMAIFSFLVDALSWALVALLPASTLLPSIGLGTFGVGASSSIRALAVAEVPKHDSGRLFAALGVIDALGMALAGPILAYIFSSTLSSYPEAVFLFVAAVFGACSIVFLGYRNTTEFKYQDLAEEELPEVR